MESTLERRRRDPSASASRVSRGDERAPCTLEDTRRGSAPRGVEAPRGGDAHADRRGLLLGALASVAARVVGASSAVLAALAAVKRAAAADEAAELRRARIPRTAARRVDPALADGAAPTSPSVRGRYATRARHARGVEERFLFRLGETSRRFGARAKRAAVASACAARACVGRSNGRR